MIDFNQPIEPRNLLRFIHSFFHSFIYTVNLYIGYVIMHICTMHRFSSSETKLFFFIFKQKRKKERKNISYIV